MQIGVASSMKLGIKQNRANATVVEQRLISNGERVESMQPLHMEGSPSSSVRHIQDSIQLVELVGQCLGPREQGSKRNGPIEYKIPACRMGGPVPRGRGSKAPSRNGPATQLKPVSQAQRVRVCTSAEGQHGAATSSRQRPTRKIPQRVRGLTMCNVLVARSKHRQHASCRSSSVHDECSTHTHHQGRMSPQQAI